MDPISQSRLLKAAVALALVTSFVPTMAEAQRRRPVRGPVVRTYVYVAPHYYPRYYDAWYQWGYPYPPFGPRYGLYGEYPASVRLQVTPREADVFVDGYHAGTVDDFDGLFQRLRLRPGGHEITVFLEGYETVREAIYLEPGAERKLQFAMNRLAAGERSQPPPAPAADEESPARTLPDAPGARDAGNEGDVRERRETNLRFGTLVLRVQPPDAEILIDNERWATSASQDRLSIELPQGRHSVEVRRQGSSTFREDVLIRPGATLTLNVSLK